MSDRELPETIPISYLNALEYCPRRFHYEFVQGDMLVNDFVLGGTLLHERADEPGKHTSEDGATQINRLYLYSEKLRLSGFADVIEEHNGVFVPVEYKHGRQGRWFNDHIQLCAQALCLEERQPGSRQFPTAISSTSARANASRLISHPNYALKRWPQLRKHSRSPYSAHLHRRSKEKWRFVVVIVVWHHSAYPKK